jgi:hypothetical protein
MIVVEICPGEVLAYFKLPSLPRFSSDSRQIQKGRKRRSWGKAAWQHRSQPLLTDSGLGIRRF